jgi:hypothetical protein
MKNKKRRPFCVICDICGKTQSTVLSSFIILKQAILVPNKKKIR